MENNLKKEMKWVICPRCKNKQPKIFLYRMEIPPCEPHFHKCWVDIYENCHICTQQLSEFWYLEPPFIDKIPWELEKK